MVKHLLVAFVEMIPMRSTLGYTSSITILWHSKTTSWESICQTHSQDPQKIKMDSKDYSFKVACARENRNEFVV